MTIADKLDMSSRREPPLDPVRSNLCRTLRRFVCAIAVAMMLATMGGAGSAFALTCIGPLTPSDLTTCQINDQQVLLSPFATLLNSPAGLALLAANLQTDETIYLNATPARRVVAAENSLAEYAAQNILIGAFPANPAFFYTQAGVPTTPALPTSVTAAIDSIVQNLQVNALKNPFGAIDVYGIAYNDVYNAITNNGPRTDSNGDPRPFQVSNAIAGNPFTPANSSFLAAQIQQTANTPPGSSTEDWQILQESAAFPSGHSAGGNLIALTMAILAPGYYQQLAQSGVDFGYSRNVFGAHYPLDVIGGRIEATYVIAQTLSGNPLYPGGNSINLPEVSQAMQAYLGGGASSPYAAPCAAGVAACMARGVIPTAAAYTAAIANYTRFLTYDLPSVGDTTLAPIVPAAASVLIATRFPYLNTAQLNQILATTELPSGVPLDNGTGWARLNLYAAASGYGAFPTDVAVNMNAALGGLNAFDIWSNNITGPGGLTLQGSGTLILAGNDSYTGGTIVQGGTLGVTGMLAGNVTVWSGASFAGNGVIGGSLALLPGASFLAAISPNSGNLIRVGGTATISGSTVAVAIAGDAPALGRAYPILVATGGVSGSFSSLTEPASGLLAGTRLDTLYSSNAVSLVVTPGFYGNLTATGLAENASESAVGGALDAIRPAPGVALDPAHAALFGPLYLLPAGSITTGLDELAPSIYADTMITTRNAWYLMAHTVSGQLAARRGLAADSAANSAPGPHGSTIWISALGGYDMVGAGDGAPGFTAGLGGMAAGIDVPVGGAARIGVAVGTVEGQTWAQSGGNATSSTAQLVTYGQWQRGMLFAEAQLGLMYQQETVHRTLPLFGASMKGTTKGLAGGGGVRVGIQQTLADWLIEPSLGFGGFGLHMGSVAETGGALAETIGGATVGSAESTLAVGAQRGFALSEAVRVVVKGRLGWSHEFADNVATVSAGFSGLSGSGFALNSAPIGRDAAVVGLGGDITVASWPVTLFVGYGGAINASSNAQSFNAGMRVFW